MKQTDVVRDYEICQALARDHGFQISPSSGDEFYVSRIDDDAASKVHGSIEEVRAFLEGYDLCDGRREDEAEAKAAESDKEEAMTERKTQAAHSGTRPSDCSLPEWCERVTFRSAGKGEVILRVPGFDKFGEKMATNRVLSVPLAWRLLVELATALEQEENAKLTGAAAFG